MSLGPVMLDVAGTDLDVEDRELLKHPSVGGVILFARNIESPEQVAALCGEIHALRDPHLLIAVDQEGGRVQRLRDGFVRLPAAARFGELALQDPRQARDAARAVGWLMASELRTVGIDFSFAPVLDIDRGLNTVIGDRAFARKVDDIAGLSAAWRVGMGEAGMAAVGKHFPGHGGVAEDSHTEMPRDRRSFDIIAAEDLIPFERLIAVGLEAVMPAHVIYERVDPYPAGFSRFWLQQVLRAQLGFQGVIFSDDLNMAAAAAGGGYGERARAALDAGCDMALVCNNRPGAIEVVEDLADIHEPVAQLRLLRMHGRHACAAETLHQDTRWRSALDWIERFAGGPTPELSLVGD